MSHRSFIPLYVFALLISLVPSLRAQTTNRNKPRAALQNSSKTIPSKTDYAYKIIAKREAGKETTIGGVKIKEFDDNWLSQFVLAENGDIIFRAYTNRGAALFKNNQALAYPGKTFPGSTVSDGENFYPLVLAVSRDGDVLFQVKNRYHGKNGSDYLGPVIVLNDKVVCEPWAVQDPDDHTDRIVRLAPPQAGFTESGQYAMGVEYRKYTPRLDEKGHQFKDSTGKLIFDISDTLKYLVGGSIVDERPEIVEQRLDARMRVGPTGIPIKSLFQRIFGIDVDSFADIGPHHLSVASGLLVLRNHTGQIAVMLGTLRNGAWLPVRRGASGGQAVVLATPTNVKPEDDTPFSKVLTDGFWTDIERLLPRPSAHQ